MATRRLALDDSASANSARTWPDHPAARNGLWRSLLTSAPPAACFVPGPSALFSIREADAKVKGEAAQDPVALGPARSLDTPARDAGGRRR